MVDECCGDGVLDHLATLTPEELAQLPPFPFPSELFPLGTFPLGMRFVCESAPSTSRWQ